MAAAERLCGGSLLLSEIVKTLDPIIDRVEALEIARSLLFYDDPTTSYSILPKRFNTPIHSLFRALLQNSILEASNRGQAKKIQNVRRSARNWLLNQDLESKSSIEYIFSFRNVCENLGINPFRFRAALEEKLNDFYFVRGSGRRVLGSRSRLGNGWRKRAVN